MSTSDAMRASIVVSAVNLGRRGRGGGFTLVELVATIVVIAILGGIAFASLSSIQSRQTRFAAQQTAADLGYLRERAQATGLTMWVVFDVGDSSWTVLEDDPSNPGFGNALEFEDPFTGRPAGRDLPAEFGTHIALTAVDFDGETTLGFDWNGRPILPSGDSLEAETGQIVVNNAHTITIHAETGAAAITP